MGTELDIVTAARTHQGELLAEAATRRLLRSVTPRAEAPNQPGRRIQTLLRRLAGAPTFA